MARAVFSDLNVGRGWEGRTADMSLLKTLIDSGYERVALCHHVTLRKGVQLKPAPNLSDLLEQVPTRRGREVEVLQRLTVTVEDPSVLHTLSSPAAESYDLLAVSPASERVFLQACSVLPIDIVTFDLTQKLPFILRHSQLSQAVERGLLLEICYSPALRGSSCRRSTITNAQELVKGCRGKNVLVSSGAERALEVRPPPDVVNLCRLFDLSDSQCKAAVTTACRTALLHSRMRRHSAKAVVSCHPLPERGGGGGGGGGGGRRKRGREENKDTPVKKLKQNGQ